MRRSLRLVFHTMCAAAALSAGAIQAEAAGVAAQQRVSADSESADDYAWIDKADSLWEVIGNAPPDRSFAFEGGEPWAWETRDGYRILVEDNGAGIRSFYFEPGADAPFLAVEPGMSFGFDNGSLAVVYGPGGDVLSDTEGQQHRGEAKALYQRGERMLAAMLGGEPQPVDTGMWIDTAPLIQVFLTAWDQGRAHHSGWRRHRETDWNARALRRRLEAERLRRMAITRRFENWRSGGYQGTPPGRWRRPDGRPRSNGDANGERYRRWQGAWARPGGDNAQRPPRGSAGWQPGVVPAAPVPVGTEGERPRRQWGDANRPGMNGGRRWRPQPPAVPATTAEASSDAVPASETPRREGANGGRPRPASTISSPPNADTALETPAASAPRWNRGSGGGWNRPRPAPAPAPVPSSTAAEAAVATPAAPPAPRWNRENGGGSWNRVRPATPDASSGNVGSDASTRPAPRWNQRGDGMNWNRPRPAPQPSYTPPASYTPTPSYTPPTPTYTPPAPTYTPPASGYTPRSSGASSGQPRARAWGGKRAETTGETAPD